jgi:hypothetical protein
MKSCTPIGLNPRAYHVASKSRGSLRNGGFSRGAAHQNVSSRVLSRLWHFGGCRASAHGLCGLEMAGCCKQRLHSVESAHNPFGISGPQKCAFIPWVGRRHSGNSQRGQSRSLRCSPFRTSFPAPPGPLDRGATLERSVSYTCVTGIRLNVRLIIGSATPHERAIARRRDWEHTPSPS